MLFSSIWPKTGDILPNYHLEDQIQPCPERGFRAAFEGNNTGSFWESLGVLNMNMIISSRANSVLLTLSSWTGRRSQLLPFFAGKIEAVLDIWDLPGSAWWVFLFALFLLCRTTPHRKAEHPRDCSNQGQPGLWLAQGTDKPRNYCLWWFT